MVSLFFDGDLRRIYEVPEASTFVVDGSGYRIYTPIDVGTADTDVQITSTELWSRWVDYHNTSKWARLAFNKTGGAFRDLDNLGNEVYATFDIRLINDWQIVPANYPHKFTIAGNLFENLPAGTDFDVDRITVQGVSPRIERADSLQIVRENGGGNVANVDDIAEAVWDYLESNTTCLLYTSPSPRDA